ncbi:hypothetical protein CTheo_7538 [Ceratobasidium theobromae]|uniref:Uncharacterized protein n=1 Tax=Ceratobasidium theobromae TaxID=1582974 RepID=A0A5N5QC70_9AGAM|nr:hypothetical protein CTheo_7538 [Ceratobasidium theobromae]
MTGFKISSIHLRVSAAPPDNLSIPHTTESVTEELDTQLPALTDTTLSAEQPRNPSRSQRSRKATSRGALWAESHAKSRDRSAWIHRTKCHKSKSQPGTSGDEGTDAGASSYAESQVMSQLTSRSPTPECSQAATAADKSDSRHQELVKEALQLVEYDCTTLSTADLQEIIRAIRTDQTPAMAAPQGHIIEASALSDTQQSAAITLGDNNHLGHVQIDGQTSKRVSHASEHNLQDFKWRKLAANTKRNAEAETTTAFQSTLPPPSSNTAIVPDSEPDQQPCILVPETQPNPPYINKLCPARQPQILVPDTQLRSTSQLTNSTHSPPPSQNTTSSISLGQTQPHRTPSTRANPQESLSQEDARASSHRSTRTGQSVWAITLAVHTSQQPSSPACPPTCTSQESLGIMCIHNTQGLVSRCMAEIRAKVDQLGSSLQTGTPHSSAVDAREEILAAIDQFMADISRGPQPEGHGGLLSNWE